MIACEEGNVSVVAKILMAGAGANAKSNVREYAMYYIIDHKNDA